MAIAQALATRRRRDKSLFFVVLVAASRPPLYMYKNLFTFSVHVQYPVRQAAWFNEARNGDGTAE